MSTEELPGRSRRKTVAVLSIAAFLGVALLTAGVWWKTYRSGQGPSDSSVVEGTPFSYEYVPPRDPKLAHTYEMVRDMDLFARLTEIKAVDGMLVLPKPIHFIAAECQEVNAFYSPPKAEMVLCYELVNDILAKGKSIAKEEKRDKDFPSLYLVGALRFVMLHELGHALIDQLQLPITGREETAADEFAAVVMLQYVDHAEVRGGVENSISYAGTYLMPTGNVDGAPAYADEHEMGEQRYFNLLCMIYGSDPAGFLSIVTEKGLPEQRASSCPAYSARMMTTWGNLLYPHAATNRQLSTEEWEAQVARGREAQDKNVDQYIR